MLGCAESMGMERESNEATEVSNPKTCEEERKSARKSEEDRVRTVVVVRKPGKSPTKPTVSHL